MAVSAVNSARKSDAASPGDSHLRAEDPATIEVILGTKAQYIKTAPVLRELSRRGISYRLLDTGQHAALIPGMRRDLDVKEPNLVLADNGNIATLSAAFLWAAKIFADILFRPNKIKYSYFAQDSEYCLIHGDTPSTLLSLLMAKRAGKKVVHIEAGLRSFNYLKPFPEEIIRIICMRYADILFAPSEFAAANLKKMNIKGEVIELTQNTNVEALYYSIQSAENGPSIPKPFALFTVHRVETIFSSQRLAFAVRWACKIAEKIPVVFVMHDPTRKQLSNTKLMADLENAPNVDIMPLMPHARFAQLLDNCEFVVTDGGSIQEEAYFLDKPCLILRTETERDEGVGSNARIGGFDDLAMEKFIADYKNLRCGHQEENKSPSAQIVDRLLS